MSASARDFPQGDIRVSDADRDRALAELSEHFQAGRLTQEEWDERSGRALRARTGNELSTLLLDLPGPAAAPEPSQAGPAVPLARACSRWSTGRIVIACVIAAIVVGNVFGNIGHGFHQASFGWLIPLVVLVCVFRRIHR